MHGNPLDFFLSPSSYVRKERAFFSFLTSPWLPTSESSFLEPSRILPYINNLNLKLNKAWIQHLVRARSSRRSFNSITVVAKSIRSTKSDVMMLTPMAPGFWVFTQSRMAGRFLWTSVFLRPPTRPRAIVFTLGVRMAWETWKAPRGARSLRVVSKKRISFCTLVVFAQGAGIFFPGHRNGYCL